MGVESVGVSVWCVMCVIWYGVCEDVRETNKRKFIQPTQTTNGYSK